MSEGARAGALRLWARAVPWLSRGARDRFLVLRPSPPVSIDTLVSPLRYDILVRLDFFRMLERDWQLFQRGFEGFKTNARKHPYGIWFRDVVAGSVHPEYGESEERFDREFARRLRRSADLLTSFRSRGLDRRHPVRLRSGDEILPTASGKRVDATLFAGNGCHRLALLLLAGRDTLEAGEYVVHRVPRFQPRDNTGILLRNLELTPEAYYRFLSRGFAARPFSTREDLRAHVSERSPVRAALLDRILALDEAWLAKRHG